MRRRAAAWLAWAILVASLVFVVINVLLNPVPLTAGGLFVMPFIAFGLVGAIVALRRPEHTIGWLFGAIGLATASVGFGEVGSLIWYAGIGLALTFTPLLFPTGHLPSPRWRPVAWLAVVSIVLLSVGDQASMALNGQASIFGDARLTGLDPQAAQIFANALQVPFLLVVLASAAALITRFRHARGQERQQLKWFVAASGPVAVVAVAAFIDSRSVSVGTWSVPFLGGVIWPLSLTAIPIAAGIAVLRYRLYDIDLIINRALVYGLLSGALVLTYFLGVVLLQGIFRALTGQGSDVAIVVTTLAVAALVLPLRRRIQAFIDRSFYRRKYDASRILAAYGAALRDDADIQQVSAELLGVVGEAMRPAHASLWLRTPEGRR